MNTPSTIGTYQVERRLGGGGMAEVFLARRIGAEGFSRRVAIKRILPGASGNSAFASLFIGEARLSSALHHPNIVSILDFDRDPDQGLFLVMELIEGRDLAQLLDAGRLPIPTVLYIIAEVLRGLGHAHAPPVGDREARGLVHRDVSPHNVLLSWEGDVKVSDFGIAKAKTASNASASLMIKGKPCYMSPEQANGEDLDGRSDLFAVGVMMWEMLVGESLFGRPTLQETLAALFGAAIASPSSLRPDVPEDVAQVALKLLERKRANRFANAEEARAAILSCAAAPRDGRADLAALLLDQFGGRVADNARAPTLLSGMSPSSSASPGLLARGTPAADASSAVGAQGLAPRPWASRKWAFARLCLLLGLAATLAVLALSRSSQGRPTAPPGIPEAGNAATLPTQQPAGQPQREGVGQSSEVHAVREGSPNHATPRPSSTKPAPLKRPKAGSRRPADEMRSNGDSSGIIDLRLEESQPSGSHH